jgi:class 3 adenylate cyclase/tetratricopeptide (TPR) repeat protein
MRCWNCGSENPTDHKFCEDCGRPLENRCPKCGAESTAGKRFCGGCGAPLDPIAPAEKELRYRGVAGERRHLTVLFCDLVGSTKIAAQLDPEEWLEIVAAYHHAATEAINGFGGYVAQYLGDGIMAYFGWPEAHENDAERSVRAGLAILERISKLNEHPTRPRLSIRVGIHSGAVVVDSSAGKDASVFGETPNVAARVQAAAVPDSVLITAATHRLISGLFIVEAREDETLKGASAALALFEVIRPTGVRGRLGAARGLTPFVGREQELQLLLDRWQQTCQGDCQLVLVVGEAGIGKSRLVAEFHDRIRETPHIWMEGAGDQLFESTPFYAVTEMLARWLELQALGGGQRSRAKESATCVLKNDHDDGLERLERALGSAGLMLDHAVPLIAELLQLSLRERYPALTLTPEQKRQQLLAALAGWLFGAAQLQPVVMVVEDLHWLDPSTLELQHALAEKGTAAPLMLLYTARPEFRPQWLTRPHHTHITLNRLNNFEVREMIKEVAARQALTRESVDAVMERTGGIPLFIEELTLAVVEGDKTRFSEREIPLTLHDSLMARLDRLGGAKEVAQTAATIGREFTYELLSAISPVNEAGLTAALNRLVDAELLDQQLSSPRSYAFRHALIRDAAYESVLHSQRREYHRKLAEVLQQNFPETVEAQPELLANHFTEAGAIEEAIPHWQRAAQQALQRSANKEAIRHLTKALELLGAVAETPLRLRQQLQLLTMLGTALIATKGFSTRDVIEVYSRARTLSQRVGEAAQFFPVLWGQWVNCSSRAEYGAALEFGQECLSLARNVADPVLIVEAHHALGVHYCTTGEFEQALEHLQQATTLYNPTNHHLHAYTYGQDPAVLCRIHAGFALWFLGYPDQTLNKNNEALTLVQKLAHPATSAMAAAFGAQLYQFCGDVHAAAKLAATAVDLSFQHELDFTRAMGTIIGGRALTRQGEKAAGIQAMRAGLDLLRATDAVTTVGYFSGLLAEAYAEVNEPEAGLKVLARVDNSREKYWEAELCRLKGELMYRLIRVRHLGHKAQTDIEESFRQALTIARAQNAKSLELRATMSLARLLTSQGHPDDAHAMLAEIYNWFTEGFDTADLKEAKALLDDLARS